MPRQRRAGGGVDQLPSGRYRVRIVTPDGRRVSLGTHPTKRAAEAAYARSVTEQADGKHLAVRARGTTLAEYAPKWLDSRLRMRGPDGPGACTGAKCYRLLRTIMGTAVEDGLVITNPCSIKGAGTEPASKRPIVTVAQAFELADLVGPRFRAVVLLAAFVGLRKGEMLGMRRADLDLDAAVVTVEQQRQLSRNGEHLVGPPKTDAGRRTVSIPSALIDDLRCHVNAYAQLGDDGYVFTGIKGGPLASHVLQKAWANARGQLGLDDVHLHDLRHLAGTLAASTGAGTKELMHRLGHASPQAALRYQHATRERDVAIAGGIDNIIQGAVGESDAVASRGGMPRLHDESHR